MKNFKPGILLTSITTILAFMAVLYTSSCDNKAPNLSPTSCENVACQNAGYCNLGTCICPIGYQDNRCATKWSKKFLGTWFIQEQVTSSDNYDSVGNFRSYWLQVDSSASPTSIFLTGLRGDGNLKKISAVIDSTNIRFNIAAYTPVGNGNFNLKGGNATLVIVKNNRDTVIGSYYTDYLNAQYLRERDTISFMMTK